MNTQSHENCCKPSSQATSLNCSHVFCKLCISQWMKVKKECPNCRTPITSQVQALALDSYIDRMVEQLNDDLKQRRKELLESRKGLERCLSFSLSKGWLRSFLKSQCQAFNFLVFKLVLVDRCNTTMLFWDSVACCLPLYFQKPQCLLVGCFLYVLVSN